MKDRVRVEPVESGSKVPISVGTQIVACSSSEPLIKLSAWPVRVGATGGMNWKSFKAARKGGESPAPLRAQTK